MKKLRTSTEIIKEIKYVEECMKTSWELNDDKSYWKLFEIRAKLKQKKFEMEYLK